ncbi:mucoidy inhibitor MuiA family protein [Yoonia sp. SS1-5]|uniref:Mucoidy inhibitor MuiA family protein n=1 Tax=Yoonia rhodophyticola TaxID=3137370 RepID=A0ABZ3JCD1_9RHOB
MFRPFLTASLITFASSALADTFVGQARVDTVTIYPGVATVSREITLTLPAGQHDIIVPDLPQNLRAQGMRLSATNDAVIGAVNLSDGRLPVTPDQSSPDIVAAKAEIERLEAVLRESAATVERIKLRVKSAEEQITFLQNLSQASVGEALDADSIAQIQAMAQMVGAETLAARQAAFAAQQEADAAERARKDDIDALADARKALAALMAPQTDGAALNFTLTVPSPGDYAVTVSTLEGFANWSPVYDMRLSTADTATLDVDRSVVVSQESGQDWLDINLILSTARPGEQITPGDVFPPVA